MALERANIAKRQFFSTMLNNNKKLLLLFQRQLDKIFLITLHMDHFIWRSQHNHKEFISGGN